MDTIDKPIIAVVSPSKWCFKKWGMEVIKKEPTAEFWYNASMLVGRLYKYVCVVPGDEDRIKDIKFKGSFVIDGPVFKDADLKKLRSAVIMQLERGVKWRD